MKRGKTAVIVGAQWGDEGKGKIVDVLSHGFSIVARYAGGHNAGHTVIIQGKKFVLQLVPWGTDGLSLDLMRRDKGAQPGLNDFLIVETIKAAAGLGV